MPDIALRCVDCQAEFVFSEKDQKFFQEHEYKQPRRCKNCRAKRKAAREAEASGAAAGAVAGAVAGSAPLKKKQGWSEDRGWSARGGGGAGGAPQKRGG